METFFIRTTKCQILLPDKNDSFNIFWQYIFSYSVISMQNIWFTIILISRFKKSGFEDNYSKELFCLIHSKVLTRG